jgi:hypothetical protein
MKWISADRFLWIQFCLRRKTVWLPSPIFQLSFQQSTTDRQSYQYRADLCLARLTTLRRPLRAIWYVFIEQIFLCRYTLHCEVSHLRSCFLSSFFISLNVLHYYMINNILNTRRQLYVLLIGRVNSLWL